MAPWYVASLFAASERLAESVPVGRPVAGAAEAGGIHEGLHEPQLGPEPRGPISREAGQRAGQHLGGEIRDLDPRQDEEPAVIDHPVEVGLPLRRGPADPLVAHAQGPGGGTEGQGRHGPVLEAREVLEAMAEQFLIPEIMIAADQRIPERLQGRLAHHLDRERPPGLELAAERRGVEGGRVRCGAVRHAGDPWPRAQATVAADGWVRPRHAAGPSLTRPDTSDDTGGHCGCLSKSSL
jgi:hypothetical protein